MSKPSIPKGTRDFLPNVMVKRNYIFDTINEVFKKYSFLPIETPCIEKTDTLMGKYGEEGDRLIFKVLDSGEYLSNVSENDLSDKNYNIITPNISSKALRYDLTVPFARFVVQHQNDLAFPFKRYQVQPVWRADRPQKGRYREFYQCDADVVGSDSLLYEIELIQIYTEVLSQFNIQDYTIKVNNRKILTGIAEKINMPEQIVDLTVAIDKLDKIGKDGVLTELSNKGFTSEVLEILDPLFNLAGDNEEKFKTLKDFVSDSEIGLKGIEELEYIFKHLNDLEVDMSHISFEVTLARGLNYYTGAIFEVNVNNVEIGSICGGGRYDDLTGIFGLKDMSGVGISFGADRIYDVLEELNLFPDFNKEGTKILLINFGVDDTACLQIQNYLRNAGLKVELYPTAAKLKKQMQYADKTDIQYVLFLGEEELKKRLFKIKDLRTGNQQELILEEITQFVK